MIPDINFIGNGCILAAGLACLTGIAACLLGHARLGRLCGYATFAAMTLANAGMIYALLANDFSVSYVSHVGAIETPRFFAGISLWSSLEGSILFWGWILSGYTAACLFIYRSRWQNLMPWVTITLLAIGFFFYLVLYLPANPFHEVFPVPDNGPGPNPLLQNHWLMSVHPPLLYLGYVGMSVPFAFAVASLVTGDLSDTWVLATRRWTLTAWMFLSAAIICGGWWSYAVLGWGGYWAWDPVENASFMPWLTATAFLHSVMVQEKRQMLKVWNLFLIVTTFLLTILGTFLTRSGVLESVHSFTQSDIGHYFLSFISVTLAVSVALLIWKGGKFRSPGKLDHPASRETIFLLNNLLLTTFCFVVLLGTLYPLIVEALQGVKVSVGAPFFNKMTVPLAVALIFLMGVGSALPWRKAENSHLKKLILWPALAMVAVPAGFALFGVREIWVLVTASFTAFSAVVMLTEMFKVGIGRIFAVNPRRYGGFVVHLGVIVIALGIALSGNFKLEREVTVKQGESFELGRYTLQLDRLRGDEQPQRFSIIAQMNATLTQSGRPVGFLFPRLNYYNQSREPIGSPSVRSTPRDDLYLTLMAFDHKNGTASIRAIVTPAVSWIWGGGGIILFGTLLAMRRKECHSEQSEESRVRADTGSFGLRPQDDI